MFRSLKLFRYKLYCMYHCICPLHLRAATVHRLHYPFCMMCVSEIEKPASDKQKHLDVATKMKDELIRKYF